MMLTDFTAIQTSKLPMDGVPRKARLNLQMRKRVKLSPKPKRTKVLLQMVKQLQSKPKALSQSLHLLLNPSQKIQIYLLLTTKPS